MHAPLVWLPFPVEDVGEVPPGLDCRHVRWTGSGTPPEGIGDVELWVPPYQIGRVDPVAMALMSSLRVVQTMTAGVDHIRASVPAGVTLCNGRGIHDTSTAELALALTLAALRGIPDHVRSQGGGEWRPRWGRSLADRQVLIVGHGQIGAAIEDRLRPFECEVVRVARRAREGVHPVAELRTLLPGADVVILIVPGTPGTKGMFDADTLSCMKDGALLVNLARGNVVDTGALIAELETGRITAAVDVTDPEPLPPGHPLWSAPGLLITPHVGGASSAMWPRAHRLIREQLRRFAAGETLVNQMTGDY